MNRLIIFTDFASLSIPMILTKAILQAVCKRSDVEIAGLCIINPQKYRESVPPLCTDRDKKEDYLFL